MAVLSKPVLHDPFHLKETIRQSAGEGEKGAAMEEHSHVLVAKMNTLQLHLRICSHEDESCPDCTVMEQDVLRYQQHMKELLGDDTKMKGLELPPALKTKVEKITRALERKEFESMISNEEHATEEVANVPIEFNIEKNPRPDSEACTQGSQRGAWRIYYGGSRGAGTRLLFAPGD